MSTVFRKRTKADYLRFCEDIGFEVTGSLIVAISIVSFALPALFPMTGFSGIAIILNRFFRIPVGLSTVLLNIPVAYFCFRIIGRSFVVRSLRCMLILSFLIDYVAPFFPVYTGNRFLAALVTGTLGGIGYAIVYMRASSTGGVDFLIRAIKAKKPYMKLGTIIFLLDFFIVITGGILFRDFDGVVYGLIINTLYALLIDKILYGQNSGKLALIVTGHGEAICKLIDSRTRRGSTILNSKGGYKMEDKQTVMVVCGKKQMVEIISAVKKEDPNAFLIMMEAAEIHGKGFSSPLQ